MTRKEGKDFSVERERPRTQINFSLLGRQRKLATKRLKISLSSCSTVVGRYLGMQWIRSESLANKEQHQMIIYKRSCYNRVYNKNTGMSNRHINQSIQTSKQYRSRMGSASLYLYQPERERELLFALVTRKWFGHKKRQFGSFGTFAVKLSARGIHSLLHCLPNCFSSLYYVHMH